MIYISIKYLNDFGECGKKEPKKSISTLYSVQDNLIFKILFDQVSTKAAISFFKIIFTQSDILLSTRRTNDGYNSKAAKNQIR
jgi:hypothetical protein